MRRRAVWAGLVACVGASVMGVGTAAAALTTISCGQVVQQDVVLQADVGPCPGHGFLVQSAPSNNITVDLNGHRVIGIPGSLPGVNGPNDGVRVASTTGVTIKNGTITGFAYGIELNGVNRTTVSNMTIVDNSGPALPNNHNGGGIYLFFSNDNFIRGNRVIHNGPVAGIRIETSGGNVVENNVIRDNNVRSEMGDPHFPGEVTQQDRGILISGGIFPPRGDADRRGGHIIRNNQISGSGYHGIDLIGFTTANLVAGNIVSGNGLDQPSTSPLLTYGNGISVAANANVIEANTVTGNGGNGIYVALSGNQVLRNTAVFNAQRPNLLPNFDLKDNQFGCPGNVWSQNRFVTFNQPCVTT